MVGGFLAGTLFLLNEAVIFTGTAFPWLSDRMQTRWTERHVLSFRALNYDWPDLVLTHLSCREQYEIASPLFTKNVEPVSTNQRSDVTRNN